MPPRLWETGVPRSDPAVLLGWSWSRARCSFSARGRRVDRLPWRFCAQRRHPRRRQVCARRDALSSWREVRRPLPHRPGPSRSSTPDAFAPQARLDPPRGWRAGLAWAPALGSHCGLRGRLRHRRAARSEPIAHALQVPRPTPPRPARASRLLRLSRALRVAPLSASRGPAPAVHACPRQRLVLGRSALVGDALAPQARLQAARGTSIARPFGRL